MLKILFAAGVLDVQVVAGIDNSLRRHPPGSLILLPIVPPRQAAGKLLELDRLGLGVVLPAFRQGLFVVPDLPGRPSTVEEEEVGGDAGIGGEDPVGEADDGVEVELLEELLLNPGADAVAEQGAIGDDHPGPPRLRLPLELAHDELEEEKRRFRSLHFGREVVEDTLLLLAPEWRVGEDHIHPLLIADLIEGEAKAVVRVDPGVGGDH